MEVDRCVEGKNRGGGERQDYGFYEEVIAVLLLLVASWACALWCARIRTMDQHVGYDKTGWNWTQCNAKPSAREERPGCGFNYNRSRKRFQTYILFYIIKSI